MCFGRGLQQSVLATALAVLAPAKAIECRNHRELGTARSNPSVITEHRNSSPVIQRQEKASTRNALSVPFLSIKVHCLFCYQDHNHSYQISLPYNDDDKNKNNNMTKGGKLPNAKPNTKDRNNATTDNNFKALYSIRDDNHKTGNTNWWETRESNQAIRDLEKSASNNGTVQPRVRSRGQRTVSKRLGEQKWILTRVVT
ncbi:hypothetical protein VB005_01421 [Metarhizium brunneum]